MTQRWYVLQTAAKRFTWVLEAAMSDNLYDGAATCSTATDEPLTLEAVEAAVYGLMIEMVKEAILKMALARSRFQLPEPEMSPLRDQTFLKFGPALCADILRSMPNTDWRRYCIGSDDATDWESAFRTPPVGG